jgi:hypothetical protein
MKLRSRFTNMKIFNVLGFGLMIVILKFLVPDLFAGLSNTLLAFFSSVTTILSAVNTHSMTAGYPLQ